MDLAEKTLAELNELADTLRVVISRDPQTPGTELENVKWEVEKRHWRKDSQTHQQVKAIFP